MSASIESTPYEAPAPASKAAAPRHAGFYYGWAMVAVAAVAMAATLPGRTHGIGLITKRMLEELEVSRGNFALMNCIATLLGAAFCMPCGWLIDRWSLRALLGLTVAALGGVVIWMATINDSVSLAITLTLSRGIGQSMLSVISIALVARWFQRRIGPAMGLYSVQMSFLMAAATGGVGALIQAQGWRYAWSGLGWTLLASAPLLWFLARNQPRYREIEFLPSLAKTVTSESPTWLEALRAPAFWTFSLSISFFGLISAGLSLFQQYVLEEAGFNESVFQTVLVIGLLVGMVTNLVAGALVPRVSLPKMLAFSLAILAGSQAFFPWVKTMPQVLAYAVVHGIAGAILTVLFFAVWGKAFGGPQLGRIQGAAQMMTVFASAAGPLLVEWSHAASGSYQMVFNVSAVIAGTMAVAAWLTPLPQFATPSTMPS